MGGSRIDFWQELGCRGVANQEVQNLPIWTVDTWRVRPGKESHFLKNCGALSPGPLTLFRDLEKPGLFWSPAKWESRERLEEWRTSDRHNNAVSEIEKDVFEHVTHLMESVPEFAAAAVNILKNREARIPGNRLTQSARLSPRRRSRREPPAVLTLSRRQPG